MLKSKWATQSDETPAPAETQPAAPEQPEPAPVQAAYAPVRTMQPLTSLAFLPIP
jgi:hypothetical protein